MTSNEDEVTMEHTNIYDIYFDDVDIHNGNLNNEIQRQTSVHFSRFHLLITIQSKKMLEMKYQRSHSQKYL